MIKVFEELRIQGTVLAGLRSPCFEVVVEGHSLEGYRRRKAGELRIVA